MSKNAYRSGAAIAAIVAVTAGAGGYLARAHAEEGAVNTPAAAAPAVAPQSFADIVERVAPAVVSIDVLTKPDADDVAMQGQGVPFSFHFGAPGGGDDNSNGDDGDNGAPGIGIAPGGGAPADTPPMHATASGFFISPDGYIVTNNHVVQGAEKITVRTKDGTELKAKLIGADPATDLAVIKVDDGHNPYVSFEDRAKPRVGDWVVAVGNPFGLGGTATAGIVSALARRNISESNYVDYMQIDAPINRGNSGGPTFDSDGRVVGVNTAIYSPSGGSVGIGFDIPADVAAQVSRQLIEHGSVVRGYIGASIQDVTPDIADSLGMAGGKGALIAEVKPDGPAAMGGLKPGDIVQQLDGHPVDTASDLTRQVGLVQPGETIHLSVRRDGHMQEVDLKSGARPAELSLASAMGPDAQIAPSASVLGMRLKSNPQGGVTVEGVNPNSDAGQKGVNQGDVILRAGQQTVATPDDLASAVAEARKAGRKDVLVLVARGSSRIFVPLQLGGDAKG